MLLKQRTTRAVITVETVRKTNKDENYSFTQTPHQ